jgi:hypothetical protein
MTFIEIFFWYFLFSIVLRLLERGYKKYKDYNTICNKCKKKITIKEGIVTVNKTPYCIDCFRHIDWGKDEK